MEAVTAAIAVAVLWAIARREVGRHLAYAVRGLAVAGGAVRRALGARSWPSSTSARTRSKTPTRPTGT